jgi:uncharacterized protein (TIGR02452 family)
MKENPWRYKEDNKIKAQKQIKYMDKNFAKETAAAVANTNIYTGPLNKNDWTKNGLNPAPYSQLLDMSTVNAIFHVRKVLGEDHKEVKVAALNFASYRNPGGRFIDGSNAQEECLCHESNLYNILRNFTSYYKENNSKPNKNLYTDRALYSPDVIFNKGDRIAKADIITCASPNWAAACKWNVSQIENSLVLAQRIQFIKDIAELETVDVLILGAWGCGVFGQNPRTVAKLFNFIFRESKIKNIVYAIPGGLNSDNFKAFDECVRKS